MSDKTTNVGLPKRVAFTPEALPLAVGNLFAMNNYDVVYDVKINGAQVDIIAKSKSDPFMNSVYIEATIEYVNNTKYSKDTTKFVMIREQFPDSKLLCVSSTGFTADVRERAAKSRIETLTYDELFARFEKFSPYLNYVLSDEAVTSLVDTYEEPFFQDSKGHEMANAWLKRWKAYASSESKWLIILGEYGTGKTTLTRILQHRWLEEYRADPSQPIPIRIELRNFSRQFDARGLLHHFLDTNRLSHVPIEFLEFLIKSGRVILLLDGYDEMAQFLNARERRACLSALAELSSDGAKGILTSRPNYFTENEELNVFEALYASLEQSRVHLGEVEKSFFAREIAIDSLVERYILEKYERSLQDLTPEQTRSLVAKKLKKSAAKQQLVLTMLDRVFREETNGSKALSGKPVIISYLLEVVDDIAPEDQTRTFDQLTEWQVYELIVDRLMIRDMQRTAMSPIIRRNVLQRVALAISARDKNVADEQTFQDIIGYEFGRELRTLSVEERQTRRIQLFEDLRSSATLTRATIGKADGYVFSHNSLREFLVAEHLLNRLIAKDPVSTSIPISTAMRNFVASITIEGAEIIWTALAEVWPRRVNDYELGSYICLLWDRARRDPAGAGSVFKRLMNKAAGEEQLDLNAISLRDVDLSELAAEGETCLLNLANSVLADCHMEGAVFDGSSFVEAVLDNVSCRNSSLRNCDFRSAFIFECDLSGSDVNQADFRHMDKDSTFGIENTDGRKVVLAGSDARGYLKWHGALVDDVDSYFVFQFHPKFGIVSKILEKISGQKNSQKRGLTQRGEAQNDPPFARGFLDYIESKGWIEIDRHDLVSATPLGRTEISKLISQKFLCPTISDYLESTL